MHRSVLALTVAIVALAAPAGAAAQEDAATLTPVGDESAFPQRSWILSLPEGEPVDPRTVSVREDGGDVRDLRVLTGREAGSTVVLVLDASLSMRGRPIEDAMDAARAFAARRGPQQALGVVVFNGTSRVLLAPTTEEALIDRALARAPELAPQTTINDAVAQGLTLLGDSGVRNSLVVLSDGSDTGSRRTADEVVAAAERQNARVFGVGLQSGAFAPGSLRELADGTDGRYSLADSSGSLRGIFEALGSRLASELELTYQSLEPAGSTVEVVARVARVARGPRATATYETPELASSAPPPPPAADGFWSSTAAMVGLVVAFAGLLAAAVALFLRRPRRERLRERVAAFGPGPEETLDFGEPEEQLGAIYRRAQGRLSATDRWQRFEQELDVARIPQSAVELAFRTALASATVLLLSVLLGAGLLIVLVLTALPAVAARIYVKIKLRRQRRLFADQLGDSLLLIGSALRAGHSLAGAFNAAMDDAPEPTRTEFARLSADERLGVPLDTSVDRIAARMQSQELQQVAIVATLQQQTGGNTAEVLDRVVESVREREDLRRLVRTLTAQGRLAQLVVTLLPVCIAGYIYLVNREYLQPLFEPGLGQILLIASIVMVALGSLAIRKIIDIKV